MLDTFQNALYLYIKYQNRIISKALLLSPF